jgi:penicillin-binding protein 1C
MEINLTAIWETLTAPFRAILRLIFRRARSRRSLASRLNPAEKKLRTIRWIRFGAILAFVAVLLGTLAFFLAFAIVAKDLPKPGEVVRKTGFSTKIFDRNGKLLYDLHADERREPITIDQIPDVLKKATVSTEDKDFYKHGGIDPLTPFRIVYNYIFRKGRLVGGSTLTQQLVKNALLTNERSLTRKFKEFVLSIQIERKFTKDQILEMYFNETPYGGNAAGAGAAAQMYFGKSVSQLNLVESAIMAGLPQSPTRYSPFAGRKDTEGQPLWKVRAIGVLRRMYEDGHIKKDEYEQALKDLDNVTFQTPQTGINAPHFVFYVRDQLEKQFGDDVVAKGGLQVTTTLDLDLQNKAQGIVKEEVEKVASAGISNGSAMVMNPKTGEILSMVGSADYNNSEIDGQFNVAVDGLRQPGSSIKPITYLAMFRKGYTPATMLVDVPTTFQRNAQEKKYEPKNYDGKFRGPVSLRESLGNSLNIPSVKALAIGGLDNFLSLAYEMGFPTLEPTPENMQRFGLSVTLGGAEVHLIDTMTAYSAFANGGTKVQPVSILKVADSSGNTMFEFHPVQGKRVISEEEAFLINHVLSDNNARLVAFGPNSLLNTGKPIAVKTGTTNDKRDNWAVGWSQEFIVGTWVGNNDFTAMKQVASGISGASPIWRKIVNETMTRGYKAPDWKVPPGVDQVEVDNISGLPKHDDFPSHTEYVIHGTLPALPDPIHSKLKVCRGDNKLATDAKIAAGDYDQKEYVILKEDDPWSQDGVNRWQEAINIWIAGQNEDKYKPPTEYCGSSSDTFVRLGKPNDQTKYDKEDIEIEIDADSGDGIEKIELWVDGNVKEVINNKSYRGTIRLNAGRHEIYAKAKSRAGKEVQSSVARIGTGGQDWKAPEAVPSPTPSPSPAVVVPSPSPSATPLLPNGSPHP